MEMWRVVGGKNFYFMLVFVEGITDCARGSASIEA